MISEVDALKLVRNNNTKKNIVFHMLAVEAIMRATAKHLGEDDDKWGLVGLLHDVDYEKTETTPERHSLLGEEILKGIVSEEIIKAIKSHNASHTGIAPQSKMEKALVASDAISGLIIACALVMPSKRIAEVKTESVAKKFGHKDFAKGADRDRILLCEEIGIPKSEFIQTALEGLKGIAERIEL
jgi:putative nucleotidyltransferase with HDIG domain